MIKVGDIEILRALETSDLDWLYSIENNAEWWHFGISKEPWSKDVLSKYIHSQPGNLMRDGQLRLILEVEGSLRCLRCLRLRSYCKERRFRNSNESRSTRKGQPKWPWVRLYNAFTNHRFEYVCHSHSNNQ